jgi:hypothetical protein
MPVTLPIEVYEVFEKGFGREDAKKVLKSFEAVIGDEVINKWHQTKDELKEELLREIATKSELENLRIELLGKIDKLNLTLRFLIVLVIIAITLMNPVAAEIIKGILKI